MCQAHLKADMPSSTGPAQGQCALGFWWRERRLVMGRPAPVHGPSPGSTRCSFDNESQQSHAGPGTAYSGLILPACSLQTAACRLWIPGCTQGPVSLLIWGCSASSFTCGIWVAGDREGRYVCMHMHTHVHTRTQVHTYTLTAVLPCDKGSPPEKKLAVLPWAGDWLQPLGAQQSIPDHRARLF